MFSRGSLEKLPVLASTTREKLFLPEKSRPLSVYFFQESSPSTQSLKVPRLSPSTRLHPLSRFIACEARSVTTCGLNRLFSEPQNIKKKTCLPLWSDFKLCNCESLRLACIWYLADQSLPIDFINFLITVSQLLMLLKKK